MFSRIFLSLPIISPLNSSPYSFTGFGSRKDYLREALHTSSGSGVGVRLQFRLRHCWKTELNANAKEWEFLTSSVIGNMLEVETGGYSSSKEKEGFRSQVREGSICGYVPLACAFDAPRIRSARLSFR